VGPSELPKINFDAINKMPKNPSLVSLETPAHRKGIVG
jgi:hypothetical protein